MYEISLHMKIITIITAFIFAGFQVNAVSGQDTLKTNIKKLVSSYACNEKNAAIVVGVVNNDQVFFLSAGGKEKGNKTAPDSSSIFPLGEITSVFTGILLADFDNTGVLKMNDPLQQFLPDNVRVEVYRKIICTPADNDRYNAIQGLPDNAHPGVSFTHYTCYPDINKHPQQIVLCDLASHTSGLPDRPFNPTFSLFKNNKCRPFSTNELFDFLNRFHLFIQPGTTYSYSSTSVALLGQVLCLKSGKTYEELLAEKITNPLHMSCTHINLNNDELKKYVNSYTCTGKIVDECSYDAMKPSLALHSSAADMIKFIRANMDTTSKSNITMALQESHHPKIVVGATNKNTEFGVGLGWFVTTRKNNVDDFYVWKDTHSKHNNAFIGFCGKNKTGVVILTTGSKEVKTIGTAILQLLYKDEYRK